MDYRSARRFQLVTVMLAWLPFLGMAIGFHGVLVNVLTPTLPPGYPGFELPPTMAQLAVRDVWPVGLVLAGLLLWLLAATGVPSYFFHPKGLIVPRQNAAVAMSYYCCGPLALLAVPVGVVSISLWLFHIERGDVTLGNVAALVIAVVTGPAMIIEWWRGYFRTAKRTMPQFPGRAMVLALLLPAIWLCLPVVCLLIVPLIVVYVLVVVASFAL